MVCIYCSGKTAIINSRPQKRVRQTWRRHSCLNCKAVFTTTEQVDMVTSIAVKAPSGIIAPFSRDKLFVSLLRSLGHRNSAIADAGALTATVIAKLYAQIQNGTLSCQVISLTASKVLERFDTAAAVQYQAYHPS